VLLKLLGRVPELEARLPEDRICRTVHYRYHNVSNMG
jgi:hypothetical protein